MDQPYPGLRPFDVGDAFLFFGREKQTQDLLDRLSRNRFLAVVGTSGSGKSSLVRAGLMPALYRGYLMGATTHWRIAVMRPGGGPINELARALAAKDALDADPTEIRTKVEASSLGLMTAVQDARLAPGESLLLVVDQFEELFRFASESRSSDTRGEALLFVSALLEAVDQFEVPIYVVLTMRTDFLGDCTQFPGLPEALNRSQYLIPRLSREERRDAIEGPIEILGAEISARLVQQILNDMGDDPDQLPVMQHALSRMYRLWKEQGTDKPLDFEDYQRAGGVSSALNDHAQQIYERFDEAGREWTRKLFRCLTKMEKGREIRRPGRLERVFRVVGAEDDASRATILQIILTYTTVENSLLFLSESDEPEQRIVDISHESLIRKWKLLGRWVKEEAESADWVCDLMRDTRRQAAGEADFWRDPELSRVLARKAKDGWTAAWAEQYGIAEAPGFDGMERFLRESQRKERRRKLARYAIYLVSALLVLSALVGAELYRDAAVSKANEKAANQRAAMAESALLSERTARAKDVAQQQQLEQKINTTTSGKEKDKLQDQLIAVNKKIVDSLQKENRELTVKVAELMKVEGDSKAKAGKPVYDSGEVATAAPDATAPLRKQLEQQKADIDKERLAKTAAETKYQSLLESTRGQARATAPPPAAPKQQPATKVQLEGNSAVRTHSLLLVPDFHDIRDYVQLYILWGNPTSGETITPFEHDARLAKQVVDRLQEANCNGQAAPVGGYLVSCFKVEERDVKPAEGKSAHLHAEAGKQRFSLVVTSLNIPSNKDKAVMEVAIQAAID